jgi:hypothetical protein
MSNGGLYLVLIHNCAEHAPKLNVAPCSWIMPHFKKNMRRGFVFRWRAWIAMLLASASSSILLNGVPGPKIWHGRGLRQGNALSSPLWTR